MRPHSPDQVVAMKSFADSQPSGAERKTYALNGLEVTYTTVDMGAAKPFDYAVAAFVAPREDGKLITEADYEIVVSDDLPEELQGIWAWHELHDFAVLGHEAEDRCLQSEQILAESMSSDPDLYQRYLSVRIPFYEGLATFITADFTEKGGDSVYSPADLKGCYDAIAFLETYKTVMQEPEEEATPSMFELAKAKRAELGTLAAKEAVRVREKTEQDRIAKAEAEKRRVELKNESDKNAKEFISLMEEKGVATVQLFHQTTKSRSLGTKSKMYINQVGTAHMSERTFSIKPIGKGWVVRQFGVSSGGGLILLSSGETFRVSELSNDTSTRTTSTRRSTGEWGTDRDEITYIYNYKTVPKGSVCVWEEERNSPVECPYAGNNKSILVDAIVRLGADKPVRTRKSRSDQEPESPSSPTAWVGRPDTR